MEERNGNHVIEKERVEYDFDICEELAFEVFELTQEESQVIVHFKVKSAEDDDAARIWKTTYLIDAATGVRYPLVHAEGISYAPDWTMIPKNKPLQFTLIFKGLPKKCKLFHLIEMIPEPGGFEFRNIPRNSSDIYLVTM
nr:hypothetical protein [uncultured Flavobacterium sp.]